MNLIWIVCLIIACSILYRAGGIGGKWFLNTKMRDCGCAVCCIAILYFINGWSWWSMAMFLPLWGALSQYWKFGQEDCKWYHWLFHGLGCGIAFIPYAYFTNHMTAFYIQVPAVAVLMCIISEATENDWVEELGRGAILGLSCLLYFIK